MSGNCEHRTIHLINEKKIHPGTKTELGVNIDTVVYKQDGAKLHFPNITGICP